ncbi:MAG: hypothetical protein QMD01_07620 [Thermodesulfovibrionales bacterium]|nr:hypothetical protein [Thermodesulfovibrionales bacterium]
MGFDEILIKLFGKYYTEADFVEKTYAEMNKFGFDANNAIACVSVCRDEITQPLIALIRNKWGEAFNLSSLAGMFFAGQTGLAAAMHHSPNIGGKERYVFYSLPHIAIDADGRIGVCKRIGRQGESTACGALVAFQKELSEGKLNLSMDDIDIEQNLLKRRLLREIPYGHVPDLLELTKITQKVVQKDIEYALNTIVDRRKSDYAVISGVQIHGPEHNYVWVASCYAVVNEVMEKIEI